MSAPAPAGPRFRAPRTVARDLRLAARSLRRSPGFAATLLLLLAFGAGLAVPLFSLVRAGLSLETPVEAPVGLELPLRGAEVRSAAVGPVRGQAAGGRLGNASSGAWGGGPVTIAEGQTASLRVLLWTLGAAAAFALLIACTNLALLLLSRGAARKHEIAMRAALGATPRRLRAQLLAEGTAVALPGLSLGLAFGIGALALLGASWPEGLTRWVGPAPGTAAAALGLAPLLLSAILFGLAPAGAAREGRLRSLLAGGTRATAGPGEAIVRNRLSVVTTAVSLMLLASAALLLRGFGATGTSANPGFDPSDTLALEIAPAGARLSDPRLRAPYLEAVLEEVSRVPGVAAASLSSPGAWAGLGPTDLASSVIGDPSRPGILRPTRYLSVSPGYFAAHRIPLLAGREFTASDRADAMAVAVVSENFAHRFFVGVDPVGKLVQPGSLSFDAPWYRIVGVVSDVRPGGLGAASEPEPALYLSSLQVPPAAAGIAVRTFGDPLDLAPAVERAVHRAGPALEIERVGTLEEYLARLRAPLRWFALLFGALALFSALLAASGVYGVIAYNVARRTREIGIRAALGASPRRVVGMVVRQAMGLTGRGLVLGFAGALCLGRLLQYFFRGVDPLDPVALGGVAALLAAVALLAALAPARAAARVEPSVALRAE